MRKNLTPDDLSGLGYLVETAADGVEGVARVETWRPDVVLLDLAMPRMGGLRALSEIRSWSTVPIIVLSVMGEEADNVRALDAGADDYLTKPFGIQELNARIRVALRHAQPEPAQSVLRFGDVRPDISIFPQRGPHWGMMHQLRRIPSPGAGGRAGPGGPESAFRDHPGRSG